MTQKWRDVRVFISSTFRDMDAERDMLVKRVFPRLRERLLPYRIHLIDIDLRWGITPEEAESDRTRRLGMGIKKQIGEYCLYLFWMMDNLFVARSATSIGRR